MTIAIKVNSMKKLLSILFLITCVQVHSDEDFALPWQTEEHDPEIETATHLIQVTEKNLHDQKELLDRLQRFKEAQKLFLNDANNKQLANIMIETATEALSFIKENSLEHLFSQDFLKEMTFFSQFNSSKEIASP